MTAPTPASFALHGCDISEFQAPHLIPQMIDFAIVRATFGRRKDKRAPAHVAALRKREACRIGLFHFFTDFDPVDEQLCAFSEMAEQCEIGVGDIVPHVDVEDTTGKGSNPPVPAWCSPLFALNVALRDIFGASGHYVSQHDWLLLGSPPWMLEGSLWVPHWRRTPGLPASPGGVTPRIWQYGVGPWNPRKFAAVDGWKHPKAIDHDCVITELPLIVAEGSEVQQPEPEQTEGHNCELTDDEVRLMRRARGLMFGLTDDDREAMRRERDELVRDHD